MKKFLSTLFIFCAATSVVAQTDFNNGFNNNNFSQVDESGNITNSSQRNHQKDSLGSNKVIPRGLHVWTVDERFGDRTMAIPDTASHMYMNSTFTEGYRGEYNTLGNLGSPRIARIFIDRKENSNFLFTDPYDFIVTPVSNFHFTNTLSPITNVTLNECGDRTNGEDDFKAWFAVNAGKRIGLGFRFDYLYGRGYYQNQSTSHFKYTMWGSYMGDQYQAQLLFSTLHQKATENGGITNDNYITHPEEFSQNFSQSEIPTVLQKNWNRNDNQHVWFSHRYNIGFNRKVKMTEEEIKAKKFAMASAKENAAAQAKDKARRKAEKNGEEFDEEEYDKQHTSSGRPKDAKIAGDEPTMEAKTDTNRIAINSKAAADSIIAQEAKAAEDTLWLKNEYVPVTSFIHTVKFENYRRIYEAYNTPAGYYLNNFYNVGKLTGDSIYDKTNHLELKNTLALGLLEGFQKWMKMGLKAFVSHDLRQYQLPTSLGEMYKSTENTLSVGGQLVKTQGNLLHFNITGEAGWTGKNIKDENSTLTFRIDGNADVNIPFLGDTLQIAANAFVHNDLPSFYYRHYQSRHFSWGSDSELDNISHARIMGTLSYPKTKTKLRFAYDNIKNYTYFAQSYTNYKDSTRRDLNIKAKQESDYISIITAQLEQNFTYGIFNWENVLTYQLSSKKSIIAVPTLNVYSNLYIKFLIAKVLNVNLGVDVRYFTEYEAPEYAPAIGQYAVQDNGSNNVTVGNYPLMNAYLNFYIKHTRFFVSMSNFNSDFLGGKRYFNSPHYPLNTATFRFGVSWTFFN